MQVNAFFLTHNHSSHCWTRRYGLFTYIRITPKKVHRGLQYKLRKVLHSLFTTLCIEMSSEYYQRPPCTFLFSLSWLIVKFCPWPKDVASQNSQDLDAIPTVWASFCFGLFDVFVPFNKTSGVFMVGTCWCTTTTLTQVGSHHNGITPNYLWCFSSFLRS